MAEFLFREALRREGCSSVDVASAGVSVVRDGMSASKEALDVMAEKGIDLSSHRTRQITSEMIAEADLVLTMTEAQKRRVLDLLPGSDDKVYTLLEYVASRGGAPRDEDGEGEHLRQLDISDPFGSDIEGYRRCAREVEEALTRLAEILKRENSHENRELVRIAIASDHAGYPLKELVKESLRSYFESNAGKAVEVEDFGTWSTDSVDYPDFGVEVAKRVASGEFDRGILICGTGIGMSIAANKVPGVRAALCRDEFSARMARKDNDSNVITLGARVTGAELAWEITRVWLETEFEGGRHRKRLEKLEAIERQYLNRGKHE